jgi:GntR family transcriptional regulator
MMDFDLDPRDPTPLYLQLAALLRRRMALGALRPGDQIPTVRELAVRARVNRNTAARAVAHLESEGVVRTRVGQGTFVDNGAAAVDRERRDREVDEAIDRMLVTSQTLGMPLEELGWRLSRRIERLRHHQDLQEER